MPQSKNSPPRNVDDLIAALRIMQSYVASKVDWLPEAPQAAQIDANADSLQTKQAQRAVLEGQLEALVNAIAGDAATGTGYFCGVRDEIYRKYGKQSEELLAAGLQILDAEPESPTEPPRAPVVKSVDEVTPTSCKIKIEVVPTAKDYKYYMGITADTAAMTLKDTSSRTTFIYEGLTEGTKYYFAVKARNTAGESAFSTVANRRTF